MDLTRRILFAMLLGILFGLLLNGILSFSATPPAVVQVVRDYLVNGLLDSIGAIFLNLLRLLVVPLVFVSLTLGTRELGGNARMGIMAAKTVALYMITTAIAISLALLIASFVQPGAGMDRTTATEFVAVEAPSLKQVIIDIVPINPVAAMAEGNMLQIIVFSILMGIALAKVGREGDVVCRFFESMNAVVMKMVMLLMFLAPIGIFALLAKLFAELGIGAIMGLAKYFFTLAGVLILHLLVVYGSIIYFVANLSPRRFLMKMRPAMLFAFSTASSNATLPVTLRTVEKRIGVHNSVAAFTIPLGATINMDGTAIMQGVATVFIAQAFGIDLSLMDFLTVILTATLASIGTAGVPGVGLIMLSMVLMQVGLPVEGIAMIIGIDRLLDMLRTAVNITGDAAVATVVAKSENLFDQTVFDSADEVEI